MSVQDDLLPRLRRDSELGETTWEAVYDKHFADVRRLVFRAGVDPADVDDVTQKTFVIAYEKIDRLEYLTSIGGWLRGIALNVVASHHRYRRVRQLKAWVLKTDAQMRTGQATPEQETRVAIERTRVRATLQSMKRKHREVLVLCDLEGLDPREAGKILKVPLNTVRSRRRAARAEFARLWRQRDAVGGDDVG